MSEPKVFGKFCGLITETIGITDWRIYKSFVLIATHKNQTDVEQIKPVNKRQSKSIDNTLAGQINKRITRFNDRRRNLRVKFFDVYKTLMVLSSKG